MRLFGGLVWGFVGLGLAFPHPSLAAKRQDAIELQLSRAYEHLLSNLQYPGIARGVVIASPSRSEPDYFFHWIRDGGLSMNAVVTAYENQTRPDLRTFLEKLIADWIALESKLQETPNRSGGMGEPFFNVDGTASSREWGRPQNDGPAIRAVTMIHFAQLLLAQSRESEVRALYRAELPAYTPIKRDLEYVAYHWGEPCYDLWEEVKGDHFFTRMAQRRAMLDGADLADRLADPGAATFYRMQASLIEASLREFKNMDLHVIEPTRNRVGGWDSKHSQLDVSVLLGSLYFSRGDGFFDPSDDWVISSATQLETVFRALYAINRDTSRMPVIGRYPEDVYTGTDGSNSGGNAWFLATEAYAELHCRLARDLEARRASARAQAQRRTGQAFLERVLSHAGPEGTLSEQIHRDTGRLQGARDLTWSYAAYIRAAETCAP